MNTKQEHIYYWCRGNKDNPDGVIKALKEKGAIKSYDIIGSDEDIIYYYGKDGLIEFCDDNTECADLIMRCGIELQPIEKANATEKQAKAALKAALAMARISQIMANDKRFGGVVSDEEWQEVTDPNTDREIYVIFQSIHDLNVRVSSVTYADNWIMFPKIFLAFHTMEQAELFLEENPDLVKDFLMME